MHAESLEAARLASSRFEPDWLKLRATYDAAALSQTLAGAFAAALPRHARIVDLGAGTGSALRLLAPILRRPQHWTLIDADRELLSRTGDACRQAGFAVARSGPGWRFLLGTASIAARPCLADLGRLNARALERADGVVLFALLDLLSRRWIDRLAMALRRRRSPILAALSVDGRIRWMPSDPDDVLVHRAFGRHQRIDKGFGRAMGPAAAGHLARALSRSGYRVAIERSDWRVPMGARAMLDALLDGIAAAASTAEPGAAARIAQWRRGKAALVRSHALSVRIGHLDVLGRPRSS